MASKKVLDEDKAIDKKMTPGQLKADIKSDKKTLKQKLKSKK